MTLDALGSELRIPIAYNQFYKVYGIIGNVILGILLVFWSKTNFFIGQAPK